MSNRTKNAGLLSLSNMFTSIIAVVGLAVLSRLLSKTDYGTYRQTVLVFRVAEPFLALGLGEAVYYFLPLKEGKRREVMTNNAALLLLTSLVFLVAMFFGGNVLLARWFHNESLVSTLRVVAFNPLFVLPILGVTGCLIVHNQIKWLSIYVIGGKSFGLCFLVLAVFLMPSSTVAVYAYVIGAILLFIPGVALLVKFCRSGRWRISLKGMKEQLTYAVPLGIASVFGLLSMNLDKLLISHFFEPDVFALYVNGAMEIPLIGAITGSVTVVILPEMVTLFSAGKDVAGIDLWKKAAQKCALIIFPAMIYLYVMAPSVMSLLYSAKYAGSAAPFRIYLLMLPIRVVLFGSIFMAKGKNHIILWRTLVSLILNLVLSVVMIKTVGYLGAAYATVLVTYLYAVPCNLFLIARVTGIREWQLLPYGALAKIMLVSLVSGWGIFVVGRYAVFQNDIYKLMFSGCIFSFGIFIGFQIIGYSPVSVLRTFRR